MKTFTFNEGTTSKIIIFAVAVLYCSVYFELIACRKTFVHDAVVWFGTFHYYIEHLKQGIFPYWDPYLLTGTYFYPNISGYGLLDPVCLLGALLSKLTNVGTFTLFIYFRLYRILFFVTGSFLLFRYVSKNAVVSAFSSGILLFTVTVQSLGHPMMDYCFTVPAALYLLLLLLDNIESPRRYLYLSGLTLITGITMNVFIPSFFLFNLFSFSSLLFVLRLYSLKKVLRVFLDRHAALFTGACLVLTLMMTSPPLSVAINDTGKDGELFAISKLVDANNLNFKKMMASEMGGDAFFDKLTKQRGVFLSYGSIFSLLYPDFGALQYPGRKANPLVISLYFGIVPLALCLIGIVFFRSSFSSLSLLMTMIVLLIAFNPSGVYSTYNPLQRFLNVAFPPLRMLDTRINFAPMITFYLCLLFCVTAAKMQKNEIINRLTGLRFWGLIGVCLSPAVLKIVMAGFFTKETAVVSGYDVFVILMNIFIAVGIYGIRLRFISLKVFLATAVLLTFADQAAFSLIKVKSMPSSEAMYSFLKNKDNFRSLSIRDSDRARNGFEFFRLPLAPPDLTPVPAFIESMVETKSAIISNVFISIFTTKRYYDLFSLLPPENQLALDGVFYPVIRFFPLDRVLIAGNQKKLLHYLQKAEVGALSDHLYIEGKGSALRHPGGEIDLNAYEDLSWFQTDQLFVAYKKYIPYMKTIRSDLDSYLTTQDYSLRVAGFSINDILISVENKTDGYLLYNAGWSKYWQAFEGEREIPVVVANYNSKAVFLAGGSHLVRFVFNPRHYKIALVLYYAGLLLSFLFIVFSWKYGKRGHGEKDNGNEAL